MVTKKVTKRTKRTKTRVSKPKTEGLPSEATFGASTASDYMMMFFGPPGVGKTTFVNGLGRVLFLSNDRGTRFIKTMRRECYDWKDYMKVLAQLKVACQGGEKPYDYVCIDHVSDFALSAENEVLKTLGIDALADLEWGKGWAAHRKLMKNFVSTLVGMNMGVVFIAHEAIKQVKVSGLKIDKTMPQMGKAIWDITVPDCHVVGYISMKPMKIKGKRQEVRILETEPRKDLYAKDRTRRARPSKGYEALDPKKFLDSFAE